MSGCGWLHWRGTERDKQREIFTKVMATLEGDREKQTEGQVFTEVLATLKGDSERQK